MRPGYVLIGVVSIFFMLALVQGVQAAETYSYVTQWGSNGAGNGQFDDPWGLAVDGSGNVYVSDMGNNRVQKFSPTGTYLTQWGGTGTGNGQMTSPHGIATDTGGYVYVTDAGNVRVQKFTSSGTYLMNLSPFSVPDGVAIDSSGNIYVAESFNNRIQKFSSNGTFLTMWELSVSGNGQFNRPRCIAVDKNDNVYVGDENNRIQKFSSSGTYMTQWGTEGAGNGQFSYPRGIATDVNGNVYVADTWNNRIQKFSSLGTFLTQWGTAGAGNGEFNLPEGIAVDTDGIVYVTDTKNYRIQKFALDTLAAAFSGTPLEGSAPLNVTFTDASTGSPAGWAWFLGDENFSAPWTRVNASAGWMGRSGQTSVVMADGSIILLGGYGSGDKNDVWRSTDHGATWTEVNASAGWLARDSHSTVVMPDGSIILTGGYAWGSGRLNDVWRSADNGATWALMNASAGWAERDSHSTVAMPDGSIVLTGGVVGLRMNDVWRSADNGATWTEVNASAGWPAREGHSSLTMPDGSIILLGGFGYGSFKNDVWRSTDNGATWIQMNASAGWTARSDQNSVVIPDGSIVMMGGSDGNLKNDVWRSTDNGATWTEVNASAGWSARAYQSSVAMPDGSIVLMGGNDGASYYNDIWRFQPAGSSLQNPAHTYTTPGNYPVTLQAYNAGGYSSTRKAGYINVSSNGWDGTSCTEITTPGTYPLRGDIQGTPGLSCIVIRSSDVVFEGNGHLINGTILSENAIQVSASPALISNVTVRNLTLSSWNQGIYYENVTGGAVENSTILFSHEQGITLATSSSVTLKNINASLNRVGVAVIEGSDDNTLDHVTASRNDAVGVWFYAARNNTVVSGTFEQNNGPGLSLDARSNNNTLSANSANFNDYGFVIGVHPNGFISSYPNGPSDNNTITGNIARNNTQKGFVLFESANDNTISGNTFTGNQIGVYFNASSGVISGNTMRNNNASYNTVHGILFTNATGNTLTTNTATSNGGNGIFIFNKSRGNFLSDNIAEQNGVDGLVVSHSRNNNLTHNRARNNGHIGINLDTAENITVYDNSISENDHGILLYFASNNTIINNTISANNEGFRILIDGNNAITKNTVTNNAIGIWVNSSQNAISNNNFNNTNNAVDGSITGNKWNTTKTAGTNIIGGSWLGGNFWSDYTGIDTNSDGIGNTLLPYSAGGNIITGGDSLPLTKTGTSTMTANYTTDISSGIKPLTVTFTDISTGNPTKINMSFGDATWANTTGPWVHTYTTEGTFFPVIYVSNGTSTTSGSNATISVNVTPGLTTGLAKAYNTALDNVTLLNHTATGKSVSASPVPISVGSPIQRWGGKPAIPAPATGWLIFIDDYPGANWEHPCRYVFIDDTGKTSVIKALSPPTNINLTRISGDIIGPGGDANSVNSVSPNPGGGLGLLNLQPACTSPDCSHNYALLINGGFNTTQNHLRYWNDISFMYQTMNQTYGYPTDHITVLMTDGTSPAPDRHNATTPGGAILTDNSPVDLDMLYGTTDVTGNARKTTVLTTLSSLNGRLTPADSLFIFTTSHGGWDDVQNSNKSILYLWNQEYISDTEFVAALPSTPGNITITMEQCYSGGFVDNFIDQYAGTQRRVIATASNGNEPSWGNGFSNAWTSGVARIDESRSPNLRADINSDNKISMWEAYNYSNLYDPSASALLPVHEHPQYSARNPANVGTIQFFSSCPAAVPPRINLTRPNVVETWYMGYPRNITWTQTGLDSATVTISLWRLGAKHLDIATNVPASSGTYTWTIPTSLAPNNDYRINISSVAPPASIVYDQSDSPFIIATTAAPGYIAVNSTPSGAWVYLDGYNQSKKTLATLTGVSPGSHNITMKLAGYYEQSSGIFVNPVKTATLNFTLESTGIYEPPFGTMVITSTPTESEVIINGVATGLMTPLIKEVDPGTYAVTVKAYNYTTPANQSVLVVRGKIVSKDFTLTPLPGVKPLPGYTNPPTDPDHDGIYEDLNGNNRLDFADVVLYFNQMEWIATHEPVSAFDLNNNSRIDFADIVKLFGEI